VLDDPVLKFVPWMVIGQQPVTDDGVIRVVVPALDNKMSRWAIRSEAGGTSERVTLKPVATDEKDVSAVLAGLGIETSGIRRTTQGEVGSGRQLDLRLPVLSAATKQAVSGWAISEPARAIDDIPPAPPTDLSGSSIDGPISLHWAPSVDDRTVGFVSYKGYAIPIPASRDIGFLWAVWMS